MVFHRFYIEKGLTEALDSSSLMLILKVEEYSRLNKVAIYPLDLFETVYQTRFLTKKPRVLILREVGDYETTSISLLRSLYA